MDKINCKEKVWSGWDFYQCSRKIWKDGYCKQHHPDSVKERRRKADERYAAKQGAIKVENKEEKMEKAAKMANSTRGQYIISQALCIAIDELKKVPEPHTKHPDIADMEYLRDTLFPIFHTVREAENKIREFNGKLDVG